MTSQASSADRWFPSEDFYSDERCKRCGVCCGSTDSEPCEHLRCDDRGRYYCDIYEHRFGLHKTVNGHHFLCVPIRQLIETNGGYAGCAYVEEIRRLRQQMERDTSDLGQLRKP